MIILIVMGLYVAIKKDLFLGIGQIMLTLFTPYFICVFLNSHKEFWEIEKKRWLTMFIPIDYTSNNSSFASMMILILTPLFIFITIKCIRVALQKKDNVIKANEINY